MLEVAAKSLGLEGGPEHVLVHGVGLNSPAGEVLCVGSELAGELVDRGGVVKEEDLASDWLAIASRRPLLHTPTVVD